MIVMKFGGTSVESAEAIGRVAEIVRARIDRRPVVVVSAMGKTTNKLLAIASAAVSGKREEALDALTEMRAFHLREAEGLGLTREIEAHFSELAELVKGLAVMGELTPRATDAIGSYGERISSIIVAALFRCTGMAAVHVDSRSVIVTDRRHMQAVPMFAESNLKLATIPPLTEKSVVVMGGFIGSTEDGVTTTL